MPNFVIGGLLLLAGSLAAAIWLRQRRNARHIAGQALLQATEAGDMHEVLALLLRKADLKARNAYGMTPLHIAATGGDVALVKLLLEHGADVHAHSNTGATPLYYATRGGGRQEVIALLRTYGARDESAWDPAF